MTKGKRPTAPSSRSTILKCPKCAIPIHVTVDFYPDPDFGDSISISVYCPKCKDTRVDCIDESMYDLSKLVSKIGT